MNFRQLIDMAIGSPEPGHVNFSALHCLLNCIAEKLDIIDEPVDYSKYEALLPCSDNKESNYDLSRHVACSRLFGGVDINEEENAVEDEKIASESEAVAQVDTASSDVALEPPMSTEKTPDETEPNTVVEINVALSVEEPSKQIDVVDPVVEVLNPSLSRCSAKSGDTSISKLSIHKLDSRISKVEMTVQKITIAEGFSPGISIMKDQLEMALDQLLLLTFLTLSKKPDSKKVQQLHAMAQSLSATRKENIFIDCSNRFVLNTMSSLNWHSSGLQLDGEASEEDVEYVYKSDSKHDSTAYATLKQNELVGHLCYTPEKMLDQLMELKGEICLLTNKLNELSARFMQQESEHTVNMVQDLQDQTRAQNLMLKTLKENQDRLELRINGNAEAMVNMNKAIEDIIDEKAEKGEMEILLADKVDFNQLQRKVSTDKMLETQCRIDKKFCELSRQINESDKKFSMLVENLRSSLGFAAIEEILKTFKEQLETKIHNLQELLQKYIESTNDECAASGARVKVLQDLACLSCDTNCVMRSVEKAKVPKLPSAHASNILSPLITYELGSIRKSGIMGYYRKGEFPHAPNAWMDRQGTLNSQNMKHCVPRHSGGPHTTTTAKDRIEKVTHSKK